MVNLGFTVLAMNAGLDSAILDPTSSLMGVIYAEKRFWDGIITVWNTSAHTGKEFSDRKNNSY